MPRVSLGQIKQQHEVIIVGGGATGIGIFRDLALHGIPALLIDKKDFSSQTSSKSSKMLHGGIRYLESLDFLLVKEALHEKNHWLHLAPHLTQSLPFHLPIYDDSKYPYPWMTRIALLTYNALSGFKNPPYKMLNAQETLKEFPGIKTVGLNGCGVYFDAIVDDARLALECLYDALLEKNQTALNYTSLVAHLKKGDTHFLTLKDELTGETKEVTTHHLIFALGPFTDLVLKELKIPWTAQLLPSRGAHLWLSQSALPVTHPLVIQSNDGRIIFVIPQKKAILVGTTEDEVDANYFDLKTNQQEIDYLLNEINVAFPTKKITSTDIISTFAGIRPLVALEGSDAHKASRHHKIFHPLENTYVIAGGKYTTFRTMGQEITKKIVRSCKLKYNPSTTLLPLRQKSIFLPFEKQDLTVEMVQQSIEKEQVRTWQDLFERRMGGAINYSMLEFKSFIELHHQNFSSLLQRDTNDLAL